jgi:hypothetical protein
MKKVESEGTTDYYWLGQRRVSSCYWINGMLNFPVVLVVPPFFMQPTPSTAACFVRHLLPQRTTPVYISWNTLIVVVVEAHAVFVGRW